MADASLNVPYIVVTGVAIGAAIVILAVLRPQLGSISATQSEIVASTAKLQERQQFLQTIDRKLTELNQQKVHEDRLAVMLPDGAQSEDAIRIVHRAAEGAGVTITSLNNTSSSIQSKLNSARARGEQSSIATQITPLAFAIEFGGSYQQLRSFITEIERSPRLMDIFNVQILGTKDDPGNITAQLTIVFYAQNFNSIKSNP